MYQWNLKSELGFFIWKCASVPLEMSSLIKVPSGNIVIRLNRNTIEQWKRTLRSKKEAGYTLWPITWAELSDKRGPIKNNVVEGLGTILWNGHTT